MVGRAEFRGLTEQDADYSSNRGPRDRLRCSIEIGGLEGERSAEGKIMNPLFFRWSPRVFGGLGVVRMDGRWTDNSERAREIKRAREAVMQSVRSAQHAE